MFFSKIKKLYGLDYNRYVCGGIGNAKIKKIGEQRELFYTESEAIKRLSELKEEVVYGDFELFTTKINKKPYKI